MRQVSQAASDARAVATAAVPNTPRPPPPPPIISCELSRFETRTQWGVRRKTWTGLCRDTGGSIFGRPQHIAINPDLDQYLLERVLLLNQQLATVNRLALANALPDAIISDTRLGITPQDPVVPSSAQTLIDQSSNLLPRIKITEVLMDVDDWTGFTRHFVHLKSAAQVQDRTLLLSAILADAINLGLTKMAESSPGANYAKLSWLQAWHIRDETYSAGLADLVNVQFRHPFAVHWGDGTTSSSDGQRFRAGGRAESTGHINPKYGAEPGKIVNTHISDTYAPFSTKMVNVGSAIRPMCSTGCFTTSRICASRSTTRTRPASPIMCSR